MAFRSGGNTDLLRLGDLMSERWQPEATSQEDSNFETSFPPGTTNLTARVQMASASAPSVSGNPVRTKAGWQYEPEPCRQAAAIVASALTHSRGAMHFADRTGAGMYEDSMQRLKLTIGCERYDCTQALIDGRVLK